jgi:hypothetical protein
MERVDEGGNVIGFFHLARDLPEEGSPGSGTTVGENQIHMTRAAPAISGLWLHPFEIPA